MAACVFILFLLAEISQACPIGKEGLSSAEIKKIQNRLQKEKYQRKPDNLPPLPTAKSAMPWGGSNISKWRPEAVLANGVSEMLNNYWREPGVIDVIVSVPVRMIYTNNRVYGDGQTNSAVTFGDWNFIEVPLIQTLVIHHNGNRKIHFDFSKKINFKTSKASFIYHSSSGGSKKEISFPIISNLSSFHGEFDLPRDVAFGNLDNSMVSWVRPEGWDSAFPVDFRMPIFSVKDLVIAAGPSKTLGRSPSDPLDVYNRSLKSREVPTLTLMKSNFGPEWFRDNQGRVMLRNEPIHGDVTTPQGKVMTASGGGLTWFVPLGAASTFKNLYTCFDARDYRKESRFGVPSGGGWHEIGDPAETIINNLEVNSIPVGFATGMPSLPPAGLKFPWNLTDIASVRMLRPGEALMTAAGDRTWNEDEPWRKSGNNAQRASPNQSSGRNYHWFLFPGTLPVCTQEWVHNCRPSLSKGLCLNR